LRTTPSLSRPRPSTVSSQKIPPADRAATCGTTSCRIRATASATRCRPDARTLDAARSADPQRAVDIDSQSVDGLEFNASGARRSKSLPVQRATPFLVPIHSVPSGPYRKLPDARIRQAARIPARGMKRLIAPAGDSRCRPPSAVPNQTSPSRVDAIDHTSSLPMAGWLRWS
jgi:hypothetical protein